MSWTDPVTRATGYLVTAANWNELVNDLLAVKSGWIDLAGTFSYASADGPTGVLNTPSDLSGVIPLGARFGYTQTTAKYGIVTAISSSTITVYGGTDYTTANAAVTSPRFSLWKSAVGFPSDPTKWTELLKDTSDRSQSSPVTGTWYNPGSLSLAIPIGAWDVEYQVVAQNAPGAGNVADLATTLSTANNSESDSDFSVKAQVQQITSPVIMVPIVRRKPVPLVLASKTSYFLNIKTGVGGAGNIIFLGSTASPTIVRARCAYL